MAKLLCVVVALNCVLIAGSMSSLPCQALMAELRKTPNVGPSHFTFYLHNTVFDPVVNNTSYFNSVYSSPPNVSFANPWSFGVLATFEDPLTVGPSRASTQIGVAHGFFLFDSLREYVLFHVFTATIDAGKYKGTIAILGQERESLPMRILTVIGGTGDFLSARGVAVSTLVDIERHHAGLRRAARWTLYFHLHLYY